jgi:hypothetical protein
VKIAALLVGLLNVRDLLSTPCPDFSRRLEYGHENKTGTNDEP